eukprot:11165467-Lingulodinium_polyedra.AAC.1
MLIDCWLAAWLALRAEDFRLKLTPSACTLRFVTSATLAVRWPCALNACVSSVRRAARKPVCELPDRMPGGARML